MVEIKDKFVKCGVSYELVKYDIIPFDRGVLRRRSVGVAMYKITSGSRLVGFNVEKLKWDVMPFGGGSFKVCNASIANSGPEAPPLIKVGWNIDDWNCSTRGSADVKYSEVLEKLKSNDYDEQEIELD